VSLGVQPDGSRAVVPLHRVGVLLVVILAPGLHVNLSPSAPRGLYQMVAGSPTRGFYRKLGAKLRREWILTRLAGAPLRRLPRGRER